MLEDLQEKEACSLETLHAGCISIMKTSMVSHVSNAFQLLVPVPGHTPERPRAISTTIVTIMASDTVVSLSLLEVTWVSAQSK